MPLTPKPQTTPPKTRAQSSTKRSSVLEKSSNPEQQISSRARAQKLSPERKSHLLKSLDQELAVTKQTSSQAPLKDKDLQSPPSPKSPESPKSLGETKAKG